MFGFNELPKDAGNGIILGVVRGDDDILNSGWCGRRHILSRGSDDAVFRNVKVSYMHLQSRVQSFELLQGLISKEVILVNPLVL